MGDIDAAHEQIVEAARVDLARRLAELLFPAANELSLVDRPGFAGVPVERVGECLTQQRADDRRGPRSGHSRSAAAPSPREASKCGDLLVALMVG